MYRLRFIAFGFTAATTLDSAQAVVTYTFADTAGGVVLNYTGGLNISALSFQGGLSSIARYVDIQGANPAVGHQMYEFQNMQYSSYYPGLPASSFRYSASGITFDWMMSLTKPQYAPTSSTGQTFGFYIFKQGSSYVTWMNLPPGYVSGSPITGSQTFAGETLASMGLLESETFLVNLPGGESIKGQVVPEPSIPLLAGWAGLTLLGIRRRTIL